MWRNSSLDLLEPVIIWPSSMNSCSIGTFPTPTAFSMNLKRSPYILNFTLFFFWGVDINLAMSGVSACFWIQVILWNWLGFLLFHQALLVSDFGPKITIKIVESLRDDIYGGKLKSGSEIKVMLITLSFCMICMDFWFGFDVTRITLTWWEYGWFLL